MAFDPQAIGERDDAVRLVLHGDTVVIAESYDVRSSILTQPAAWTIRTGWSKVAAALLSKYKPNDPFQLYVGGKLQQTGYLDGVSADGSAGGSTVTFSGRDALAKLADDHLDSERTFQDDTYLSLVLKQLNAVGLDDRMVTGSNRANLKIKSGVPISYLVPTPPRSVEQIVTGASSNTAGSGIQHMQIQGRIGEQRFTFLKRYLNLAGLFLWAAVDGSFILSEPDARQKPMSSILRKVGQASNSVNVISCSYNNRTEHRYSLYEVYGRGAGRKAGHVKAKGVYEDAEMKALGFTKRRIIRSQNAKTTEQAMFLARRMCAEDRRAGWQLKYKMSGHTTPFTSGGQACVWAPDTTVYVKDDILGIEGVFYVTDVAFSRGPQSETEIDLMRPEDLVFGPEEFEE